MYNYYNTSYNKYFAVLQSTNKLLPDLYVIFSTFDPIRCEFYIDPIPCLRHDKYQLPIMNMTNCDRINYPIPGISIVTFANSYPGMADCDSNDNKHSSFDYNKFSSKLTRKEIDEIYLFQFILKFLH